MAAHGSLAAALQAAAADYGLSLLLEITPSDPLRHATIASVVPHRDSAYVSAWHHERAWTIWGSSNRKLMICGSTKDLRELPDVIRGWVEGASLEEIGQAATFDLLTGRLEVPDNNLTDVIESEWQYLLKEARDRDWPEYQTLIEAAYAEPKLRRLYPFTSHWTLGFSTTPYPFSPEFVGVSSPSGEGGYTIRDRANGIALTQVTTHTEAIAVAVDRISAGLLQQPPEVPAQDS
ncbi:DUF6193 family natural product biosynthesis protein [Spirillospora sp. NPDC048911]|uniref:DUF6193 family natural product biosynthesis protein n=1 Tax=Spirillospora sp. NPDC048911 TaxID=3364527 RepID=UPI0037112E39